VKFFNSGDTSRFISHKTFILDILCEKPKFEFCFGDFSGVEFSVTRIDDQHQKILGVDDWKSRYPELSKGQKPFASAPKSREIEVCHREILWKVPLDRIPLVSRGIQYDPSDVTTVEALSYLDALIQLRVIRSLSIGEKAFYSPALFLRKPKGGIRKVIDFRMLNSYCKSPDSCVLGEGVMGVLKLIPSSWKFFSIIDLESGFSNLPVCSELQRLFAFQYDNRHYTYVTLPQGWSCSSELFHARLARLISSVGSFSYIDDILVGGSSMQEHDCNLGKVFQILADYGFRVNFAKVKLAVPCVRFLGFDVFPGGFSLSSFINEQRGTFPPSNSDRDIRKLLGIFNYCRKMVPRIDRVLKPIQDELKKPCSKRASINILQNMCEDAWEYVVKCSVNLSFGDGKSVQEWGLMTDWSSGGMGFALFAGSPEDGRIVSLNSKKVNSNLSSHLGELMAVKWALESVKVMVSAAPAVVVLWTDSSSVSSVLQQDSIPKLSDVRVARLIGWI